MRVYENSRIFVLTKKKNMKTITNKTEILEFNKNYEFNNYDLLDDIVKQQFENYLDNDTLIEIIDNRFIIYSNIYKNTDEYFHLVFDTYYQIYFIVEDDVEFDNLLMLLCFTAKDFGYLIVEYLNKNYIQEAFEESLYARFKDCLDHYYNQGIDIIKEIQNTDVACEYSQYPEVFFNSFNYWNKHKKIKIEGIYENYEF